MNQKGSERQRTAVKLRKEGQTYAQIGAHLGLGASGARSLVARGVKAQKPLPRACGDPLAIHGKVVNCQRSDGHLGKHRWKGGISVGELGELNCSIEWRWHLA